MADNLILNPGADGATLATAEVTFSGDTADVQIIGVGLMSGSAESFVMTFAQGGSGIDGIGVQRVSLATDVNLPAPGTDATSLGKAEDAVAASGDTGVMALATRKDTPTSLVSADGDYASLQVDENGCLYACIGGQVSLVDTNNSSTTPLAGDAVFTGTAVDTLAYGHVQISVFSDEASATDGLMIEWSSDGTNWDNNDLFTIAASTGKVFSFGPPSRFMRIVYTNGSTPQTEFRLESVCKVFSQSASSHRIADSISGQDDAELVKTVITGLAPDSTFKNALVTNAGELKVSLQDVNGTTVPVTQSGVWNITDISGTISLPTGASTSALQTTGNTSLSTIAGAVSGSEMQTDVVTVGSVLDPNNSTTTPLSAGQVYLGTGTDLLGYSTVCITIFADEDSETDGMTFQFSQDNTNWDDVYTYNLDTSVSDTRRFQFPVTSRYFRVAYLNNASTGQSAFRVQTILHTANQLTSMHRLGDDMTTDRSAQVVKAGLYAQRAGTGDLTLIDATAGGNLKVAVEEFDTSLPSGDNNIGNVDIVTLPSGNLGQQLSAASLSTTPATDIADATYIGDIKFGEAEPNSAAIKTAVELMDNVVVVLGTATYSEATSSANAIGAVRNDDLATLANTDNEFAPLQVDSQGALYANLAAAENKQDSGVAAGGAPGTDDMIAAVVGKKLLVTAMSLTATSATTNSVFVDNADNDLWANTANPIPLSMDADGDTVAGVVLPYNPAGWFKTDTINEAVTLNSSAAQDIAWSISWIETD